ncbi:MAG: domain containing protein [Deltaproteobacteria bacterium]|nr:domain containing protein [Deltaproteobacteria bacterium]
MVEAHRVRCVVTVPDGPSRRVGPSGLLIGRKQDCDLVCDDPGVSRRHALVRLTTEGAEVVPLGRGPVEINGKKCDRPTVLGDGDRLGVPGLVLDVQIEAQRPDPSRSASWRLERARGGSFGLVHSPFVLGGGDSDDLIVKRWPEQALRFHVAQSELYLEPTVAKVTRNGTELEPGSMERVEMGDQVGFQREVFHVRQTPRDATTAIASLTDLPSHVLIEMLPRGGRVVFSTAEGDRPVFLADRRLDLMIALLRPPDGYAAGDYIPDDVVRAIVWPRNPGVTRPEINVLIGRCRRDLVEAGLAGARLIVRAPGGGATRLALAPGAVVILES